MAAMLDAADDAAAATLSGFLGGSLSEPLPSGAGSNQYQRQPHAAATLASILGEAPLAQLPHPAAAMAAAAAAAAGTALPVSRRQSAPPAGMLLPVATQARQQRPCNCKRSMCLKMYCECFAAGDCQRGGCGVWCKQSWPAERILHQWLLTSRLCPIRIALP